ncbi:MAG: bifunctional phosphopantothenoylcysteine decarboxylase/phosphopantothenate--cysteine ligase CoaBC [Chloroflexota bacterium]|nr:bifunctional phosphopantothenoylcysteine decarboxylase/phosphopantothenate--cysteine ligase CoaBC [Chloroflexota bacterium]
MVEQQGPLASKQILQAVTGGIAAYKAADVASTLVQLGAVLDVILSEGAREFIQPLTFSALTRRDVHTDPFAGWTPERAGHVTLAAETDLLLVVPATANSLARLSLGLADDLVGLVALSTTAPLVIAPAMEHGMWRHPATQEHVQRLQARGAHLVEPETGRLASGAVGAGRLATTDAIVGAVRLVLGRQGPLAGYSFVISAGGTHEPIDPVRFIGNRSSGLMGFALAQAALDRGAAVTLVAGPTHLTAPYGAKVIPIETAAEMLEAIQAEVVGANVLIMAAAVSDFRPKHQFEQKYKKEGPGSVLSLELGQTADILATIDQPGLIKVGFAAETEDHVVNAQRKLERKSLSMIIANDATATIGQEESTAVVIIRDRAPEVLPTMRKSDLAALIVDRVESLLHVRRAERVEP